MSALVLCSLTVEAIRHLRLAGRAHIECSRTENRTLRRVHLDLARETYAHAGGLLLDERLRVMQRGRG